MPASNASRLSAALAAASILLGTAIGSAQKKPDDAWKRDPYTTADPAAMRQAGYLSFGPLPWGDDHDTAKIHAMMPEAKILWVETAHFRIGSTLSSLPLAKSSKSRRRLKAEIKQLRQRIPKIKPSPKRLDRWLRLHLYAARLERIYSRVQRLLGVTDASFPKAGGKLAAGAGAKYMGRGPYLGMPDKFCVLLMQKASNLTRYGAKAGAPTPKEPTPVFLSFDQRGSMMFGTSAEIVFHSEDTDHRLHTHLIFNTVQNLLRGYKSYWHALPTWIDEGLANWVVREYDADAHDFSGMREWDTSKDYPKKWDVYARRLAKNGFAADAAKLCEFRDPDQLTLNDHICAWSRIDYLLTIDKGRKFKEFIGELKAPMPHEPGKATTVEAVLKAQRRALQAVFGFDYAGFDRAWSRYAQSKYPRR